MKMKKRLLSILLTLALALGLMAGMSLTAYAEGQKAYAAYDVTTEANKTKSGDDLTALQVKFNGKSWYIPVLQDVAGDRRIHVLLRIPYSQAPRLRSVELRRAAGPHGAGLECDGNE